MTERPVPAPAGTPATGLVRRLWTGLTAAPDYPATPADRREISILGLRVPFRATIVLAVATLIQIFDYSETFMPPEYFELAWGHEVFRYLAVERFFLFGLLPLAIVVLGFRDHPRRYGLGLGDWRWGAALAALGVAVMIPIAIVVVSLPSFQWYYADLGAPLGELLFFVTIDLIPAEFLYRGFLMMTLVRAIGPIGVLVAVLPFAFAHLGKPDLEVLSTLVGGFAYGWLAWRTGSIWWGGLAHVVIYTVAIVAAAGLML